jgi:PTS system nitrogen regulatory IIA component
MHFGAALRLIRVDAGVTLRALADHVGVSSAYLSRVENGHDPIPTPDRLADIAAALRIPVAVLFELAHRVEPFVAQYLDAQPAAHALFVDIARRGLGPAQLAKVRAFVERTFPTGEADDARAALSPLLNAERIVTGVVCDDLDDAIAIASARLARRGGSIGAAEIARRIAQRERLASSAIGGGIAVPHTAGVDAPDRAALLVLARPLAIASPDGQPIDLVLCLAIEADRVVQVVSAAVRLLDVAAADIRAAKRDHSRMLAALREAEASLLGHS